VKQGEKKRLVTDYVTINSFTLLEAYLLPDIEDLVNRIARDKYFSSIEIRLACHQVPLLAEERHCTAFEADGRLFQYKRLPLGVTNGVSAFQRSIDEFIKRHRLKNIYAYLDLTVTGETHEEYDTNLKCLLNAAAECNLTINEEKSEFRVTDLEMLGYLVAFKQINPDPNLCKLY